MLSSNPIIRIVFKVCAIVCVVLGFIGIFLPLLPTTPFLLLAVFFSVRSSPAIHSWLLNHKVLGPPLHQYFDKRSISGKVYFRSVIFLWLTISLSVWMATSVWMKCLLLAIAVGVTAYLTRLQRRGARSRS